MSSPEHQDRRADRRSDRETGPPEVIDLASRKRPDPGRLQSSGDGVGDDVTPGESGESGDPTRPEGVAGATDRARARWFRRRDRRRDRHDAGDDITAIDDAVDRRIAETLSTFRSERPKVPADMVDEILAHVFTVVEDDADQRRHRIRLFVTAGGIAALAGGAIVGVVALERHTQVISRFVSSRRLAEAS